jgi:hypothetical protein
MGETQLSRIFQLYRGGQFYLMGEETEPIKKCIFNIKLGYYTCKGKVVIIAYII